MADRPDDADRPDEPRNPLEELFRSLGIDPKAMGFGGGTGSGVPLGFHQPGTAAGAGFDPAGLMGQVQQMIARLGGTSASTDEGPDWSQVRRLAETGAAAHGDDPTPSAAETRALADAFDLARGWLDPATSFPVATEELPLAWSRADWVRRTLPRWQTLVTPVAERMAEATADAMLPDLGELSEEEKAAQAAELGPLADLAGLSEMFKPMLRQSGNAMYAMQVGEGIGQLSGEVLTGGDVAVALTDDDRVALVPANLEVFAEGLAESLDDVRLYLVLRESARTRLQAAAPWLRAHVLALVEEYARTITIDTSALEQAVTDLDPTQLDAEKLADLSRTLQGRLFTPQSTPEQQAVLVRLETVLALIEGWVDDVVAQATRQWMPSAVALAEVIRRRRATGGPAEQTFSTLVGLELRPRRLRDAANLWAAVRDARGIEGRDAVWAHPDLLPSAADLDDPLGFAAGAGGAGGGSEDDLDAELAKLLDPDHRPDGDS